MKIGIISDTHGDYSRYLDAMAVLGQCDHYIHLGDINSYGDTSMTMLTEDLSQITNITFIKGNGDYFQAEMLLNKPNFEMKILEFPKFKILATHGHLYGQSYLQALAKDNNCQIVATGHTHVKKLERKDGIIYLNPGSNARARDNISSVAIIEDDTIKLIDIDTKNIIQTMEI